MTLIYGNSIVTLSPDVNGRLIEEELDGESKLRAIVIQPESGKVIVLNDVGARIWSLVDGQRTISEISSIIEMEYMNIERDVLVDTVFFIQELIQKKLLQEKQII